MRIIFLFALLFIGCKSYSQDSVTTNRGKTVPLATIKTVLQARQDSTDIVLRSVQKDSLFNTNPNFNLYNKETITPGKYIPSATGILTTHTDYSSSDWIEVKPGTLYYRSHTFSMAFYTSAKVYISGISTGGGLPSNFTTPTNCYYIRMSVFNGFENVFYVIEGKTSSSYVAYSRLIKQSILPKIEYAIPTKLFILKDDENTLYWKQISNKNKPTQYMKISTTKGFVNYGGFARITNPLATDTGNSTISVYNEDFQVVSTKSINVQRGDTATDNGAVVINAIGDSYTYNGSWQKIIKDKINNDSHVGLRSPYADTSLRNEGRGGWSLAMYFTTIQSTTGSFSPFIHPAGYNYVGNTDFWTKVHANSLDYAYDGFQAKEAAVGFTSGGFKSTPSVNDLMYDNTASAYKYWNGSAWTTVTPGYFSFNYTKYLSIWGIPTPNYVIVMLGANDFWASASKEAVGTTFGTWKLRMDTLVASIKTASSSCKVVIALPPGYFGYVDNSGGNFTDMQQYMMFHVRKAIIDNFDNREAEGIYVVDAGAAVDPDYGFDYTSVLPFSRYTGTERRKVLINVPHPSAAGYYQMGIPLTAFIQKTR